MAVRPRPVANATTAAQRRNQPQRLERATTAVAPVVPAPLVPIGTDPLMMPFTNPGGIQGNAMAGIDWILNPSIDFTESDTTAAEQAIAGGFSGSGFAGNNRLRLRDSERMNRVALGNELLQPYLNRAAETARQQISEAGLDRRLGTELANRLQIALINGDQQTSETLLREAGMDRRQSAQIAGSLQQTQLGVQSDLLRSLLSTQGQSGGGSGDGRVAPRGTNNIGTSNPLGATYATGSSGGIPFYSSTNQAYNPTARPGAGTSSGGGSTSQYTRYINQILQGYGL